MFSDVKVGDLIIIRSSHRNSIEKVTSVSKTIFCAGGLRFRKDNGWQYGGGTYPMIFAKKATDEEIEKIRNNEIRNKYYVTSAHILRNCYPSLDDIKEIYSILQKYER